MSRADTRACQQVSLKGITPGCNRDLFRGLGHLKRDRQYVMPEDYANVSL